MGNSYGFLRSESGSGFQFNVVEVCKVENVNLAQACNLTFDVNQDLISIGNVTRGRMVPQPGIAGLGVSQARQSGNVMLTTPDMDRHGTFLRCRRDLADLRVYRSRAQS
jgi:hypothetical protein